jgi:hypothetical protein
MHTTTDRFWNCYLNLPRKIQELADENFHLLKMNPRHPSLQFKKVGQFWSVRIGLDYRALTEKDEDGFTWVWIGTHQDYNRLIK